MHGRLVKIGIKWVPDSMGEQSKGLRGSPISKWWILYQQLIRFKYLKPGIERHLLPSQKPPKIGQTACAASEEGNRAHSQCPEAGKTECAASEERN